MRLNKYLARSGIASRRKADELIAAGRVRVDGETVATLGMDIGEDRRVEVDGRAVEPDQDRVVYLLHKPSGVISAASDPRGRMTVVDLIRDPRRLYPVGRLDRNTTGALLITNDGELASRLTHPRYSVEKRYLAEVGGRLSERSIRELAQGKEIEGGLKVRAQIKAVGRHVKRTIYEIAMTEGKKREIKRIFKHMGLPLVRLHRQSFAGLSGDGLSPGKYRRLRKPEIEALYRLSQRQHATQSS